VTNDCYERIFCDAFGATRLRIIHTILCAESRIHISALVELTPTVKRVVESLHCRPFRLHRFVSTGGCIYWYHASFLDFVFSQARATPPWKLFNAPILQSACFLAQRCFSIMQESHVMVCHSILARKAYTVTII
jgi:hypothetical protein